jgi:hypothetical protein
MAAALSTLTDSTSEIGRRARALAGPPLQSDSLRVRARRVLDDRLCRSAGATAQRWSAGDQYAVIQIGRTYWVRGTTWEYTNLLDDRYRWLTSFIEQ